MAQQEVDDDLVVEVRAICRQAPTAALIRAYVRAARRFCLESRWLQVSIAGATIAPTYTTGTVTVTNADATVLGVGTAWLTEAQAGNTFVSADGVEYTVLSVTSNTALELTTNYAGSTLAGQTYTLTRQNKTYNLGSDTYNEIFGIAGITLYETAERPIALQESLSGRWDPVEPQGTPEFYQYMPEAQIALHPTPDAAYSMTIGAVVAPKRDATSIDDRLVVKWEYALQDGALAYLLGLPDVPWMNLAAAQMHEARFEVAMIAAANAASLGFDPGAKPLRTEPL
jgi:hypothetical protein